MYLFADIARKTPSLVGRKTKSLILFSRYETYQFFSIRLLLPLLLIFVSCEENSEDLQHEKIDNDSLILMAMELFEDLDQSLPDQKLALQISLDENGKGTVHFSATENIQSGIHDFQGVKVSSLEEEGTECSTPIGCLKEAKSV